MTERPDYLTEGEWEDARRSAKAEAPRNKKKKAPNGLPSEPRAKEGFEGFDSDQGDKAINQEISRLAKLPAVDYERIRKRAASELDIRTSILDKLVAAARPPDESAPGKGRPLELLVQ